MSNLMPWEEDYGIASGADDGVMPWDMVYETPNKPHQVKDSIVDAGRRALGMTLKNNPLTAPFGNVLLPKGSQERALYDGFDRGVKDVIDTGAELAAKGFDGIAGTSEGQRVTEMNDAGRQQFNDLYGDKNLASVGRLAGNVAATAPAGVVLGNVVKGVGALTNTGRIVAPVVDALTTSGISSAGATGVKGVLARGAGGAVTGGVSAGLINPDDAETGALVGAVAPAAVVGAGKAIKGVAKQVLGATTGVGPDAVSTAYNSGKRGNQAFLDNMRGKANMEDVVSDARQGLEKIRQTRNAEYRKGMTGVKSDNAILSFKPIEDALKEVQKMGTRDGVPIYEDAAEAVHKLSNKITQWRKGDPSRFHTADGLDDLKKAIGDIREGTKPRTAARRAADTIYHAVREQIEKQAPEYSATMKDYSQASNLIDEVARTLSLNERAGTDTAMRKLQSVMRNNANTNYGNRANLARQLEEQGGIDIIPALAGQAMNSWVPRGLVGSIQKGVGLPVAAAGTYLNPALLPVTVGSAIASSPRTIGEMMYLAGRGAGAVQRSGVPFNRIGEWGARSLPVLAADKD